MKSLRIYFAGILLVCCTWLRAQDALTVSVPGNDRVSQGGNFNLSVFFSYNTALYKDYTLKFTLTDNMSWNITPSNSWVDDPNKIFVGDPAHVKVKSVVKDGQIYTLALTISGLSSSTNIVLRGLQNNKVAVCTGEGSEPIGTVLEATSKVSSLPNLNTSKSVNIYTPQSGNNTGYVHAYMNANMEVPKTNSTLKFPFFVDFLVETGYLTVAPTSVQLKYPSSKIQFLGAVEYDGNNFDSQKLALNALSPSNGVLSFPVGTDYNVFNKHIRVYFRATTAFTTVSGEFQLSATGASYFNCNTNQNVPVGDTKNIFDSNPTNNLAFNSGNITLPNQTGQSFVPSIELQNFNPTYCKDYCVSSNLTLNNVGYLKFEANNVYALSQSGTGPQIKLECPAGIKSISLSNYNFNTSIDPTPTITYQRFNETSTATLGTNGLFPSGTNPVQYIYISGYSGNLREETDFQLNYETIGNTAPVNALFKINYVNVDNVYSVGYSLNADYCARNLIIDDQYLDNTGSSFVDDVSYTTLNKTTYVRVKLYPENNRYKGLYQIRDAVYTLDASQYMQFELANNYILVGEQVTGNTLKLSKSGQVYGGATNNYKNLKFRLDADHLFIDQVDLNNISPSVCGVDKMLYIWLPVKVKNGTPYNQNRYRSTVSLNTTVNPNFSLEPYYGLAYWNINAVEAYSVSVENQLNCSSLDYNQVEAKAGDVITVKYLVRNALDYPIKNIDLVFPKLPSGVSPLQYSIAGVNTYVKIYELLPAPLIIGGSRTVRIPLTQAQVFGAGVVTPSITSSQELITYSEVYQLLGRRTLVFEIKYKVGTSYAEGAVLTHDLFEMKTYKPVTGTGTADKADQTLSVTINKNATACVEPPPCAECVTSLSPMRGHRYLLSAWIKESYTVVAPTIGSTTSTGAYPDTYKNAGIKITFNNGAIDELGLFVATGPIIDGWQRVESSFTVPDDANNIQLELMNNSETNDAYFDDIRLHPFRSNMKSFVYDPSTQRLTAELDENNYATLYEYDDEGILIRVKKETERGVMTIKESRNNQSKINK